MMDYSNLSIVRNSKDKADIETDVPDSSHDFFFRALNKAILDQSFHTYVCAYNAPIYGLPDSSKNIDTISDVCQLPPI